MAPGKYGVIYHILRFQINNPYKQETTINDQIIFFKLFMKCIYIASFILK